MSKKWCPTIAWVDLNLEKIKVEQLPEKFSREWIGGRALGVRLLFENDDRFIMMTGPLTGTAVPSSGRYEVIARSPANGLIGTANSGGFFGTWLKMSGIDGIVVEGVASSPVTLVAGKGEIEIQGADELWGKDVYATTEILEKKYPGSKIACIGPSGERGSVFASVMNDRWRAAARQGLGAVMGRKRLKAVVARGGQKIKVFDQEKLIRIANSMRRILDSYPLVMLYRQYGTAGMMTFIELMGDLPIRNWKLGTWPDATKIGGDKISDQILEKSEGCFSCSIRCGRVSRTPDGNLTGGPEYETLGMLGASTLNSNLEAVNYANYLCNLYGSDTISVGSAIAFAIEAYERGIIKKEDVGYELRWGDPNTLIKLTKQICLREGIGELLSTGVQAAAKKIGKNSEEFAVAVKNVEVPAHDPRAAISLAVHYAVSNNGARHTSGIPMYEYVGTTSPELGIDNNAANRFKWKNKMKYLARNQDYYTLADSLSVCMFTMMAFILPPSAVISALRAATGYDYSLEEVMFYMERTWQLERIFNLVHGATPADDRLPKRLLEPKKEGGAANVRIPIKEMLAEYYRVRHWDPESGYPQWEYVEKLGLADLVEKYYFKNPKK
ncbi:MAG: aldehyde ferredoxin oxidoreductase family protein [Candidatus Korarchaeota archaeon]